MKCRNILFKSFSFTIYLFYQLENSLLLQSEETGKLRRPGRIQDPQVISLSKLCPNSDSFGPFGKNNYIPVDPDGAKSRLGELSPFCKMHCAQINEDPQIRILPNLDTACPHLDKSRELDLASSPLPVATPLLIILLVGPIDPCPENDL